MKYINGKDILPEKLLQQLQVYIQGNFLYVPRQDNCRAGWGAVNGARQMIKARNIQICEMYEDGVAIIELMEHYHLSEDSIRKVLSNRKSLLAVE